MVEMLLLLLRDIEALLAIPHESLSRGGEELILGLVLDVRTGPAGASHRGCLVQNLSIAWEGRVGIVAQGRPFRAGTQTRMEGRGVLEREG